MNKGKQPPEGGQYPAESAERRGLSKRNTPNPSTAGTQRPGKVPSGLARVREVARRDRRMQFTTLLHHIDVSKRELRRRYNRAVPETGLWLRQVLQGY